MASEQSIPLTITAFNGPLTTSRVEGINIDDISVASIQDGATQILVESSYKRDNDIIITETALAGILTLADNSGYVQNGLVIYNVTKLQRGSTVTFATPVEYLLNRKKVKNITLLAGGAGSRFEYQVEFGKTPWIFEVQEVLPATGGAVLNLTTLTVNKILGNTAAAGVIEQHGITTGITAFAGGGQPSATEIVSEYSVIATVATAADSVKLPALTGTTPLTGRRFVLKNSGANAANVFPPVGGNLGAGVNTAVSLAAGARIEYVSTGALVYESFLG